MVGGAQEGHSADNITAETRIHHVNGEASVGLHACNPRVNPYPTANPNELPTLECAESSTYPQPEKKDKNQGLTGPISNELTEDNNDSARGLLNANPNQLNVTTEAVQQCTQ